MAPALRRRRHVAALAALALALSSLIGVGIAPTALAQGSEPDVETTALTIAAPAVAVLAAAATGETGETGETDTADTAADSGPVSALSDPALELTKSVSDATPDAGATFTYTLLYRCAGITQNCDDVLVTDVIPPQLATGAGEVSLTGDGNTVATNYDAPTRTAVFDLGNLDAGDSGQLTIGVRFPAGTTPPNTVATNEASMSAANAPTVTTAPVIATSGGAFDMTFSKSGPSDHDLGIPFDYSLQVCSPGSYAISGGQLVDTLPAGATLVSTGQPAGVAAPSVVGDTITWTLPEPWYPAGGLNACGTFTVRVRYDTPTFADLDVVNNSAVLTGTALYPAPTPVNESDGHGTTLHQPVAELGGSKSGPTWFTPGQDVSYTVQVNSTGNLPLTDVMATDTIPPEIEVTSIEVTAPGAHYLVFHTSFSGWISFPRSGSYTEAPPLGPGERVLAVRLYDEAMEASSSATLTIHGTVRTTRPTDLSPVLDTDPDVLNCVTFTSNESNPAADGNDCVTTDLRGDFAQPRLTKSAPGGPFLPNATIDYTITVANESPASADLAGFDVIDLRDDRLIYSDTDGSLDAPAASAGAPAITTFDPGDGRRGVKWDFPPGFGLAPGQTVTLSYQGRVPATADAPKAVPEAGTTIPNRAVLSAYTVPTSGTNLIFPCTGRTMTESELAHDVDGDAGTDLTLCATGAGEGTATITGVPNMTARKWVKGELDTLAGRNGAVDGGGDDLPGPDATPGTADDGYNRFPDSGRTLPGGRVDYRLVVTNESNVRVEDFAIVDVLPFVGDTATLSSSARLSEWRPYLMEPLSVAGFTVRYSTATNPCRPEVGYSGGGCATPNWTTTFPTANPTSVRAIKLEKNAAVAPGETITVDLLLRAQTHATNGDIAWNSFAYAWTRADTHQALLPSEPLKVGIEVVADARNGLGDRVWLDLDHDGRQDLPELGWRDDDGDGAKDPGEPVVDWDDRDGDGVQDADEAAIPGDRAVGVNDVLVQVYEAGADDAVGGGDDTLVGTTYTHTDAYGYDGLWWLPNQPDGDYFVVFTPPAGYTVSPANVGPGDVADSDGTAGSGPYAGTYVTAVTALGPNEADPTWDLGLYGANDTRTSLGNKVWYDSDADGVQDGGDGVSGVQVNLRTGAGAAVLDRDGQPVSTHTDTSGNYRFDWLVPGSYQVEFVAATLPSGWRFSPADRGADDALDSDANTSTGRTATIALAAPVTDPNSFGTTPENLVDPRWDAGITPKHRVGDVVWFDADADGIQDGGEPPVGGVTVRLYDAGGDQAIGGGDDALVATATTANADGSYHFTNLLAGTYFVTFTPPAGTVVSPANAGADDALDSDGVSHAAYPGVVVGAVTILAAQAGTDATPSTADDLGEDDPTHDLGLYRSVSIGDLAWEDLDADGTQDAGEPGIDGIAVRLYRPGPTPTFVAATTTAGGGLYEFANLTPGDYLVAFDPPTGHRITTDTGPVAATDSDVSRQATTRPDSTTLDLLGWALTPTVTRTVLAGTDTRFGTADDVSTDPTWDAGFYRPVAVGDRVWFDPDGDGVQENGENGVPSIAVALLDGAGQPVPDPANNAVAWTVDTDGNGEYLFADLVPGTYSVCFDLDDTDIATGWIPTLRDGGADDTADADADRATGCTPTVTLTSGQQNLTLDTGFTLLSAVGDLVWHDLDADGRQDAGEPGIQNVSVELWSVGTDNTAGTGDDVRVTQNDGVTVRPAQLTTVNGEYLFSGLLPGTYFVKVDRATLPAGYRVSPADAGADDAVDSDAVTDPTNAGRLMTGTATIATDAEDLTLDTGVFLPAAIGDRVWEDVDGDGVQDGGEPDLGVDVTVTLTDCDGTPITTDVDGNPVTATVTTQGAFRFDDIRPGTYCLQYSLPTGWERTVAGTGGDTAADSDPDVATGVTAPTVLSSGEDDLTWDAGYFRPAALGDLVWFDADGDGLQDGGELPAPGVTARLRDLQGTQLATTVTDADGRYHFTGLWPGTYQVCFERPADDWFSPLDAPADDEADSDVDRATGCTIAVTLASGDVDDSLDAGIFDDVELGDVVWEDRDLDGRQDAGEPAVPGVRLVLRQPGPDAVWDSADDVPVAETTTGTDGLYRFRGLLAGTYRVSVDTATLPTAMRLTVADAAAEAGTGDDGLDSDADVATGHLTAVTVPAGTENLTLDAGLITPFALTLTKQLLGELTAGEQATYRLTVTNTGPGTAWAGLTLTDKLPVGLSFESASGVGWACQAPTSDNDIVCTSASTLAAGATDSLELIVDVGASESGVIINTATVTAAGLERLSATVPGATVAGVVATRQPLVRTGADTLRLVLWGAALILTGVALAVPARRRLRLAPVHNRRPNRD